MRRRLPDTDRILRVSGGELAALRRFQGLSQGDLAELTGLHKNTVANVELGRSDASVLAMSLMQVRLCASGVFIGAEGFVPYASTDPGEYPFPNLLVPLPIMARIMGEMVRRRRAELGMSLQSLAEAAGSHINTVWNFENGLVAPSASTTYLIYRCLGVKRVGGSEEGPFLV